MQSSFCPVCGSQNIGLLKQVDRHHYFECNNCQVIYVDTDVLNKMDQGTALIEYSGNYWKDELKAARERAWGVTLARTAEVFLYARLPIKKFLDLGSGPGFFLDAINYQLPCSCEVFYASELFPPDAEECTTSPNFHRGSFLELDFSFDAGCCIEVIEHLTPAMLKKMMTELATKSKPNSIYIFNTGMVDYIKKEDMGYLDPLVRGHVMGWSLKSLQILLEPLGFKIWSIPGKTWAFVAEFMPDHTFSNSIQDRIWHALPENIRILKDRKNGELLYILGLETARAYG